MKNLSDCSEFFNILELVFVLSHGQVDIERGFSLKQNMEALTIISRRRIISLTHEIKLNTHTIPSNVLESVQLSRQK